MDVEHLNRAEGHNKHWRRILKCVYAFLHVCRLKEPVLRRVAFKPPTRRGYTIDANGRFLVYDNRFNPLSLHKTLSEIGLRFFHVSAPKGERQRISVLVLHHSDDFDSFRELSSQRPPSRPFILISHGNSTDMGYMFPHYVNMAHKHRVNILAYDYSGYGLSDGKPGEKELYRNIEKAYTYLREELHAEPEKIILYGNSIGSVPSSYLASKPDMFPVGGLVLDAPLASALRLQLGAVGQSSKFDAFPNVEHLKSKGLYPTLFIHGTADTVIPIQHSLELAYVSGIRHAELMDVASSAESTKMGSIPKDSGVLHNGEGAKDPSGGISLLKSPEDYIRTWWVPGANHNNIPIDHSGAYIKTMDTFLQLCEKWRNIEN